MGNPLKNTNGNLGEKTTQELMEFLEKDIFGKEEAEFGLVDQVLEELDRRDENKAERKNILEARKEFDRLYKGLEEPLYEEECPLKEEETLRGSKKRRRNLKLFIAALIVLGMSAVIPAIGSEEGFPTQDVWQAEDSPQIQGWAAEVQLEGNGGMTVQYAVAGQGEVSAIGAEEIVLWKQVGDHWLEAARYGPSALAAHQNNQEYKKGDVFYQGQPGGAYRVEVSVFSENDQGYDKRTKVIDLIAE